MSSLLTTQFIKEEMESEFGYPVMCIENIDSLVDKTIAYCLRIMNQYLPKVVTYSAPSINTGDDTIAYIDIPTATGIKKVDMVVPDSVSTTSDPFQLYRSLAAIGGGGPYQTFDLSFYMERMDNYNILSRIFSTADDWHWLENDKRLILYVPSGPKNVKVEYFEDWDSQLSIRSYHDQLFLDMMLARMKMKIGEIRRKYGGALPSPGGISIQLNGGVLYDEGKEDWTLIMEKMELLKLDIGLAQTM